MTLTESHLQIFAVWLFFAFGCAAYSLAPLFALAKLFTLRAINSAHKKRLVRKQNRDKKRDNANETPENTTVSTYNYKTFDEYPVEEASDIADDTPDAESEFATKFPFNQLLDCVCAVIWFLIYIAVSHFLFGTRIRYYTFLPYLFGFVFVYLIKHLLLKHINCRWISEKNGKRVLRNKRRDTA